MVLPAPLKPKRPKHSPFPTAKDSRSTARRVDPLLYTWGGEIVGSVPHCHISQSHTPQESHILKHWGCVCVITRGKNSCAAYLAELLHYEGAADHRLYHRLTLQDPLSLFSHIPVLRKQSCILCMSELTHMGRKKINKRSKTLCDYGTIKLQGSIMNKQIS